MSEELKQPENEKVNDKVNIASDKVNIASDKVNIASDKVNIAGDEVNIASDKVNVPSDAPGLESVTVLIIGHHEPIARLSMQSVAKNLIGVDADIRLVRETDGHIVDLLQEVLETVSTERVVLMSEQQMILNPVTLADIACVKSIRNRRPYYNVPTPVMVYKSLLLQMLSEINKDDDESKVLGCLEHIYFQRTMPEGFRPIVIGDWRADPWHLPVISENPKIDVLDKYCQWKKFGSFTYKSLGSAVMQYLKKRFANEGHE